MLDLQQLFATYHSTATPGRLDDIPIFSPETFHRGGYTEGALLRFRGLIRDMNDAELVVFPTKDESASEIQNDLEKLDLSKDNGNRIQERIQLKMTVMPHVTPWAAELYTANESTEQEQAFTTGDTPHAPNDRKRGAESIVEDTSMSESTKTDDITAPTEAESDQHVKKSKPQPSNSTDEAAPSFLNVQELNVYVYETETTSLSSFKVNDAFEFVGFLDLFVDQPLPTDDAHPSIADILTQEQQKQQTGAIFHCCNYVPLTNYSFTSVSTDKSQLHAISNHEKDVLQSILKDASIDIAHMREKAIEYIASSLQGDTLAAEYILLTLLSRVYARAEDMMPLGNLSINLASKASEDSSTTVEKSLETCLSSLVPLLCPMELSLSNLNKSSFRPVKDYSNDRLNPGELQLSHGTLLLVKENYLSTGQLHANGVKNVDALKKLTEKQVVEYDFNYYPMDFPQDTPIVTFSEHKSLLPVTLSLPIVPDAEKVVDTSEVDGMRKYISIMREMQVEIGNETAELAEKHFVSCRQNSQDVQADDLHRWLRLARLVAVSKGEGQVSSDTWQQVLEMEAKREERSK